MNQEFSRLELLLYLNSLGDVAGLRPFADTAAILKDLAAFEREWKVYNPAKPGFNRWGLSVTSLDGKLSGEPDLFSLKEYNLAHATQFGEEDFRTPTPVFHGSKELQRTLQPFFPLGRSHFLKFGRGGFFPPHRDNAFLEPECFRVFVSFNYNQDAFSFVINGKQHIFEHGIFYLINTTLAHSLVSFSEFSYFLVLNVPLTRPHVDYVNSILAQD